MSRFAHLSLRWRLMAIGLTGLALSLVVGGVLLYAALTAALERSTSAAAQAAATEVAQLVDSGRLPDPVPVAGAQVVQVLDAGHRVVGGSLTADRLTPLVSRPEGERLLNGSSVSVPGSRAGMAGELQVAAVRAGPPDARVTVVAAVPTADADTSLRNLRVLMLVLMPLLLAVLGLVAWRVIGSALRPVEALRHGAERIGSSASRSAAERDDAAVRERLPVPPTQDEISALATTLNRMLDRLEAAGERQRSFVADAAHELRSPLASLRTQIDVAERLGEGGDLPHGLRPDLQRLTALVEDLLTLARAGSGAAAPDRELVYLPDVLADLADRHAGARVAPRLAPGAAKRGAAASGAHVWAARADVDRALGNLVDNAIRHASTTVELGVRQHGTEALVTITDDGHGITPADRERVFDRFARLDEARARDSGGTGLGLAIARELLARNGSRVWLEDAAPGVRAVAAFPIASDAPGGH